MKKIYKSPLIKLIELGFNDTLLGASGDGVETGGTNQDGLSGIEGPGIDEENPYGPGTNF